MGVRHFTELRAWQLANDLRTEVYRFTAVPPAARDRRFCDDVTAACRSVCSNIAEGFGRYSHPEFAHFLNVARGSLSEIQDHLLVARAGRYVSSKKFDELWQLSVDALKRVTALWTYLKRSPRPPHRPRRPEW